MDSKINNQDVKEKQIKFLEADIIFLKAQLEADHKIIAVIQQTQDHKTAPSAMSYLARPNYAKMNAVDRTAISARLEQQNRELAKLKAKRTINFSFNNDKKDEEKSEKKDNKKDSKKDS